VEFIVSLTPGAAGNPLTAVSSPPPGASIVELRADLFPGADVRQVVSSCPLPVMVTSRSSAEGGQGPVDPDLREAVLRAAHESGAALVDFEFARDLPLLRSLGIDPERVFLSWHDPAATPDELEDIAGAMLATPARNVKVVPTATGLADVGRALGLYNRSAADRRRLLAFSMGSIGLPTRYLAPLMGMPLAFVAWDPRAPAAPGQVGLETLREAIGHLQGPPQVLYGVVGTSVGSSLSPRLHAAAYRVEGLHDALIPINVADESDLEKLFQARGSTLFDDVGLTAGGWAVTAPYKGSAVRSADVIAPRARRAEAANTLVLKSGVVIAENTDADGVVGSLTARGIEPAGRVALVQGTGGAARGAAVGLDLAGAVVVLRGRDPDRTRRIADAIGVDWCEPDVTPEGAGLLVNATPLGGHPDDPPPFSRAEVSESLAVVDMVYTDGRTGLAELATAAGTPIVDGREMLAYQGLAQFAAFTGRMPPKRAMLAAMGIVVSDQQSPNTDD